MKAIFTLLAVAAVALVSCKDDNKSKQLDPLAKISIRPATAPSGVASKAAYLSPVEVVKQTTDIVLQNPKIGKEPYYNFGISDEQRDLTTPKMMMWGMWVILDGKLTLEFIEAYDVVFVAREGGVMNKPIKDTLAYIPNATLRAAEKEIKAAYAAENYELVYQLFDKAYQFTPIDGAGWRALKAQGAN